MKPIPRLSTLGGIVFRAGNFTLGGGAPATAVLQRELITKQQALDANDFALCYALSRVTPGTNLLAFYTAVGYQIRKLPGSIVALMAGALPCCILAGFVTAGFDRISGNRWVAAGIEGALAASVGILVAGFWLIVSPYLKGKGWPRSAAVVVASILLKVYGGLSPVTVLLLAALSGLL